MAFTDLDEEFAQSNPWDAITDSIHFKLLEGRARAKRNYRRKRPALKPATCGCGAVLAQHRMGRPVKHCSRPCREKAWRAQRAARDVAMRGGR